MALSWLISAFGAEVEYAKLAASLPGYDQEIQRREDRARKAAIRSMKEKKKARA